MALSSTSTIDDVLAAYKDNADYEFSGSDGSVSKAQNFAVACRYLILLMPKMGSQDKASLSLSPELVEKQLDQARQFIYSADGANNRHFSFQNLRGTGTTLGNGGQ